MNKSDIYKLIGGFFVIADGIIAIIWLTQSEYTRATFFVVAAIFVMLAFGVYEKGE